MTFRPDAELDPGFFEPKISVWCPLFDGEKLFNQAEEGGSVFVR